MGPRAGIVLTLRWTALSKAGSVSGSGSLSELSAAAAVDAKEPSLAARDAVVWRRCRRCATAAWRCRPRPPASAAELFAQPVAGALGGMQPRCQGNLLGARVQARCCFLCSFSASRISCAVRCIGVCAPARPPPARLVPVAGAGAGADPGRSGRASSPCATANASSRKNATRQVPTDVCKVRDRKFLMLNVPTLTMRSCWSFRCRLRASSLLFFSCILAISLWR